MGVIERIGERGGACAQVHVSKLTSINGRGYIAGGGVEGSHNGVTLGISSSKSGHGGQLLDLKVLPLTYHPVADTADR